MKGEIVIAAKHIVKCALCNESFDANEESYVKVNSRRYAHATCAKQNDLQLPIINPLNLKTCIYCNKEINIIKEKYKELSKDKFAHLNCWEENKDKLTLTDNEIKFSDDALLKLVKVPRPFLKLVLKGCVDWAKQNNCKLITKVEMDIINDKRNKEKKQRK